MTVEITHHPDDRGGRYALVVDGQPAGELDYRLFEGHRVYVHTGVRDAYEGQGLAAQLVRRAVEDARADGAAIAATCPYFLHHLETHEADQDVWDRDLQARLG